MIRTFYKPVMDDPWGRLRALSFAIDTEAGLEGKMRRPEGVVDSLLAGFHGAFCRLGIVKPFSWPTWEAPMLTKEIVPALDDEMSWKHVTRIVRADRFNEGAFDSYAWSGALTHLARHLYELRETSNGWPKGFAVNPDGSIAAGIPVTAGRGFLRGTTTGRRYRCPDCREGWSIEVEMKKGSPLRACSKNWHYLADENRIFVVSEAPIRTVFRTPLPTAPQ